LSHQRYREGRGFEETAAGFVDEAMLIEVELDADLGQ
jgi:hypothetical protein